MATCNVKGFARSDGPTENKHPTLYVLLSLDSVFVSLLFSFTFTNILSKKNNCKTHFTLPAQHQTADKVSD